MVSWFCLSKNPKLCAMRSIPSSLADALSGHWVIRWIIWQDLTFILYWPYGLYDKISPCVQCGPYHPALQMHSPVTESQDLTFVSYWPYGLYDKISLSFHIGFMDDYMTRSHLVCNAVRTIQPCRCTLRSLSHKIWLLSHIGLMDYMTRSHFHFILALWMIIWQDLTLCAMRSVPSSLADALSGHWVTRSHFRLILALWIIWQDLPLISYWSYGLYDKISPWSHIGLLDYMTRSHFRLILALWIIWQDLIFVLYWPYVFMTRSHFRLILALWIIWQDLTFVLYWPYGLYDKISPCVQCGPYHPALQMHSPVTESHVASFRQLHIFLQLIPQLPAGHAAI